MTSTSLKNKRRNEKNKEKKLKEALVANQPLPLPVTTPHQSEVELSSASLDSRSQQSKNATTNEQHTYGNKNEHTSRGRQEAEFKSIHSSASIATQNATLSNKDNKLYTSPNNKQRASAMNKPDAFFNYASSSESLKMQKLDILVDSLKSEIMSNLQSKEGLETQLRSQAELLVEKDGLFVKHGGQLEEKEVIEAQQSAQLATQDGLMIEQGKQLKKIEALITLETSQEKIDALKAPHRVELEAVHASTITEMDSIKDQLFEEQQMNVSRNSQSTASLDVNLDFKAKLEQSEQVNAQQLVTATAIQTKAGDDILAIQTAYSQTAAELELTACTNSQLTKENIDLMLRLTTQESREAAKYAETKLVVDALRQEAILSNATCSEQHSVFLIQCAKIADIESDLANMSSKLISNEKVITASETGHTKLKMYNAELLGAVERSQAALTSYSSTLNEEHCMRLEAERELSLIKTKLNASLFKKIKSKLGKVKGGVKAILGKFWK